MSNFRFVSYISQGPVKDQNLTELMQAAGQAKNTPRQSGYAVHGAALTKSGRIVKAGTTSTE